jgi:septal ring-binding cell division protein DamX
MASGGKRGGGGDRVLESRHVIGLFLVMMLFSAGFFTLGYLMARDQYSGQVRAAGNSSTSSEVDPVAKPEKPSRRGKAAPPADTSTDTSTPPSSDWEFYNAGKNKQTDDHLKPLPTEPARKLTPVPVKNVSAAKPSTNLPKSGNAPLIPGGAFTLQVAALTKEADALDLAKRLQSKKFPAFVLSPQTDKYFRVQVGPYADQKAAEAARKGLEGAGFKAIVKHG